MNKQPRKKVCIVSSFPPSKCGIGTYAGEQLDRLRESGIEVLSISMLPDSKADLHFDFGKIADSLRWLRFCLSAGFDSVFVHYADGYYFPYRTSSSGFSRSVCRILQALSLRCLASKAAIESVLVIHELMTGNGLPFLTRFYKNLAFGGFSRIEFHTETSSRRAKENYSSITAHNTFLIDHGRNMKPKFNGDQNAARAELGLPRDRVFFLCVGFISYHKGVDRALEAFAVAKIPNANLCIAGSVHPSLPDAAYMETLRQKIQSTPNVSFTEDFLTDRQFDCWLLATDAVILPYRSVNSSGAGARASLFKKPLVISDIPSLRDQFPDAAVFRDEKHLAEILRDFSGSKKSREQKSQNAV